MAGQDKRGSGTWHVGDGEEAAAAAKLVGRMFDYDTRASGVRFDPEGTPPLYASLEVAGVPQNAPEPDFSQIKVERKWYGTDGKPWKPAPLKEGEALIVAVSVTTDPALPATLLTDLLPAGNEVENLNLGDGTQGREVWDDGIENPAPA